jgi:acetyl-CoA acetyltransferase
MTRDVAVIGVGAYLFRARHPDKAYREHAYEATKRTLDDAHLTINDLDSAVYGIYNYFFERQFMPDCYCHD